MMFTSVGLIFVGGLRGDVLFHLSSPQVKGAPADFHESTTVEIIWTIIPSLIVIGMALPATKVVVAQQDTTNPTSLSKPLVTSGNGVESIKVKRGSWPSVSPMLPRASSDASNSAGDNHLSKVDNPSGAR